MDAAGEMSCVATAPDAAEAQRLAAETRPDVIVMDLVLNGTDGIAATRSLRERHPGTRVLVLTGQTPTASLVHAAADAGASALLSKGESLSVVVETIASLTDHCFTLDRKTLGVLRAGPGRPGRPIRPVRCPADAPRAGHPRPPGQRHRPPDGIDAVGDHAEHGAWLREEPVPKARGPQPAGAAGRGAGEGTSRTRRVRGR